MKLYSTVIFLYCISKIYTLPIDGNATEINRVQVSQRNNTRDVEKALFRTVAIVEHKSELGRIVLLLCKKVCSRMRSRIPQWVRDYNEMLDYSGNDIIHYHYHTVKIPIPFYNGTVESKQPVILYIAAGTTQEYGGDPTNKEMFAEWLKEVDKNEVLKPTTHDDFDNYLSKMDNCSARYLLFITDPWKCPLEHWRNIARLVYSNTEIPTILVERPVDRRLEATIFRRLPALSPQECNILSLIHQDSYTLPFQELTPQEVKNGVLELIKDDCSILNLESVLPIKSRLTDLQLEYFSTEMGLKGVEFKYAYIAVGLAGGIAVIALAISIFWGLNGSEFTK